MRSRDKISGELDQRDGDLVEFLTELAVVNNLVARTKRAATLGFGLKLIV
jgi:hypothetical protein